MMNSIIASLLVSGFVVTNTTSTNRPPVLQLSPSPIGCKVNSKESAKKAALEAYSLRADERLIVDAFFAVDFDVEPIAQKGDRIWQLQVRHLEGRTRRIIWVNAKTAKVAIMFPRQERAHTPNKRPEVTSAPLREPPEPQP